MSYYIPTPTLSHPHTLTPSQLTDNVDFYNILLHNDPDNTAGMTFDPKALGGRHLSRFHEAALSALMNGPIRNHLKDIPNNVTWGGEWISPFDPPHAFPPFIGQANEVFQMQSVDFMKDVISTGMSV